ncbi:MAG: hypothetical protein ACFN4D_03010 [Cardiobacterium sp.]
MTRREVPGIRRRLGGIAIHRKPHTVLRRLTVQPRTVFGDAPCLKLSVDGYKIASSLFTTHAIAISKKGLP